MGQSKVFSIRRKKNPMAFYFLRFVLVQTIFADGVKVTDSARRRQVVWRLSRGEWLSHFSQPI